MVLTSSAINKMLRNLKDEKELILGKEDDSCTYEKVEGYDAIIPEYDFGETQEKLVKIDETVRKLKHALNRMNTTQKLEHFDITVDEALVLMAQLNNRKETLDEMRKRLPVVRKRANHYGTSNNLVEYTHVNYDIAEVDEQYKANQETINQLQMDIDYINQTVGIGVDI